MGGLILSIVAFPCNPDNGQDPVVGQSVSEVAISGSLDEVWC